MVLLETERLRLRWVTLDDADFIIELVNTPLWLKWIGSKNVHNREDAIRYLTEGPLKSYQENGYGLYLVEIKSLNLPIGLCGLVRRNELKGPDLGFAFLPEYIEKGFGFESAKAVLEYAVEVLKESQIFAVTLPENVKSVALLSKLSFNFISTVSLSSSSAPLLLLQYVKKD
jgi:[ribosomal protein S5]-alanine N-acetyltransferase